MSGPDPCSVYLDHNATTEPDPAVIDAVAVAFRELWANPSSDSEAGEKARKALSCARQQVADCVKAKPCQITFTSGGTECNHWAIHSAISSFEMSNPGETPMIVTSNVEHPAMTKPLQHLQDKKAIEWVQVPVRADGDGRGAVDAAEVVARASHARCCLVSVMSANNETGVRQPVAQIGAALAAAAAAGSGKPLFHVDAAQSVGKEDVDVVGWKADLVSIVGHKFYGPRIGAMYHRDPKSMVPLFLGGGQERGLRAGTENVAMAVGLGAAAAEVIREGEKSYVRQGEMANLLRECLKNDFGNLVTFNFAPTAVLPNTVSARFGSGGGGVTGRALLSACGGRVQASTRAACHSKSDVASASTVLLNSGLTEEEAAGTVRLSVGRYTTEQEVQTAAKWLWEAYRGLVKRAPKI